MKVLATSGEKQKNVRFVTLDGLRGVAALFIVFFHRRWWTEADMHYGYIAIDFFWLLSGFVIAHAYGQKLVSGKMSFRQFVRVRIERLWPLIVFGAMLGALVQIVHAGLEGWLGGAIKAIAAMPLAALLIPVPWADQPYATNEPSWSLFWEVLGNLAFVVIAVRLTAARLCATIIVLGLFMIGLAFATGTISYGFRWDGFAFGFPRMLLSFMVGVGLYWLWERGKLPKIGLPFWALSLALVGILGVVPQLSGWTDLAFVAACILLLFPLIIISGCQSQPTGGWRKVAVFSADISYPLYIVHYPLLFAFDMLFQHRTPPFPEVTLTVEVALICLFAWATGTYYDMPVRKWLGRQRTHAVAISV